MFSVKQLGFCIFCCFLGSCVQKPTPYKPAQPITNKGTCQDGSSYVQAKSSCTCEAATSHSIIYLSDTDARALDCQAFCCAHIFPSHYSSCNTDNPASGNSYFFAKDYDPTCACVGTESNNYPQILLGPQSFSSTGACKAACCAAK